MGVPRKPSTTPERGGSPAQRALNTPLRRVGAEPVADAGVCAEVLRSLRIVLDLPSESSHVDVQVMRLVAVIRPPYLLKEHSVGEDLVCVCEEDLQEVVFGRGQVNVAP